MDICRAVVTASDIETNRLRAILVEQRELLTDDLRKADPARWARAQIAVGDAYVAIDPPRLKLPESNESYEFRTATRRPDLPMAAYSNALSEARHLTANDLVRALVRRGSLNSGRPHAVYDCQHAVIGRIPEAGRDRSEILPFIGKRLFEAPAGIDDRNYCDARAGLAEALIAFAIEGVNRAWGNQPVLFSDGVRPYLEEAVAAARAAVSRQAPATIGRYRRVLMMALAALGAATADAALYDEAVAVGSLAAEEQRPERAAPEWQLLHYYLARTLEAWEVLSPTVGVSLAQIADCYRIAMEQPLFGDGAPVAEHLVRVARRQAARENLTNDRFIVQSALTLPEAKPAARAVWAAEAAMFAARTEGKTALVIVDAMHALARRHEEVVLWECWGNALASARSYLDAGQLEARTNDLRSCVERFNTPATWRAWALFAVPNRWPTGLVRDIPGLAELKSIAVRSGDAGLRADWSKSASSLADRPRKEMTPAEISRLKQELRDFADEFDAPELRAQWCDLALTGIRSKQYCADNLIAVRELVSATKPSARNNWHLASLWPEAALLTYEALFDRDRGAAAALRAEVKALADMVVTEPMFYSRSPAGSRPEGELYRSWNEMTLHAIRALSHSDVDVASALFEEMKSNKVTQRGMRGRTFDCVQETGRVLLHAKPAPMPAPEEATAENVVLHVADWSEQGTETAVARFIAHVQSAAKFPISPGGADTLDFSAFGERLTVAEFFRHAVATGHNLESECKKIWRLYSAMASPDAPRSTAVAWCEEAIAGMTSQTLQAVRALLELGPDPDGSSSAEPERRLLGDMRSGLAASQGWQYKANIRTVVHDAMCRADGNDIYLEKGFTDKASHFYTPREFAEMAIEQSRNLKWRVDGCESWLPHSYIGLLKGGWSGHGRKPTAFEDDVMAQLRKLAITEFASLSAAAGEPLFQPSGQLIEGRTAREIARAAINQAKSLKWRIPSYEKWMAYDYLHYFVRHCLDHIQPDQHAVVDELRKVLPSFEMRHGHIY